MTPRPWVLDETTWKTVAVTDCHVAILPWGATEAHNYHLPYATDVIECDAVAQTSAQLAWQSGTRAVVLPTVPFGVNTGQLDIKLCLNMNPSTQAALLRDLVSALEQQGILKLVILNGHGGNDFRQMIRELQLHTRVFLCTLNWWTCVDPAPYRQPSIAALREGRVWAPRPWSRVTADTGVGNPAASSREKGARYLNAVAARIASFLTDLAATDPATRYD